MLIRNLHELVADGIIDHHDAQTVPPCVHYSASEYGMTLAPVLQSLCDWGRNHMARKHTRQTQEDTQPAEVSRLPSAVAATQLPRPGRRRRRVRRGPPRRPE
ncbi:helix-turn-helix domain-containing protein [Mycobacterium sp. IS-1590]|uniref:winged helix-turn-helix transcriptional regulator n=1 Tax=Mycobacterium sp. IS-1590 TaxID=1772286 RepID=UPI0009E9A662|nr:helix-turn-helix domain-containing protein [Mycobacterium sp. IS-1590]